MCSQKKIWPPLREHKCNPLWRQNQCSFSDLRLALFFSKLLNWPKWKIIAKKGKITEKDVNSFQKLKVPFFSIQVTFFPLISRDSNKRNLIFKVKHPTEPSYPQASHAKWNEYSKKLKGRYIKEDAILSECEPLLTCVFGTWMGFQNIFLNSSPRLPENYHNLKKPVFLLDLLMLI